MSSSGNEGDDVTEEEVDEMVQNALLRARNIMGDNADTLAQEALAKARATLSNIEVKDEDESKDLPHFASSSTDQAIASQPSMASAETEVVKNTSKHKQNFQNIDPIMEGVSNTAEEEDQLSAFSDDKPTPRRFSFEDSIKKEDKSALSDYGENDDSSDDSHFYGNLQILQSNSFSTGGSTTGSVSYESSDDGDSYGPGYLDDLIEFGRVPMKSNIEDINTDSSEEDETPRDNTETQPDTMDSSSQKVEKVPSEESVEKPHVEELDDDKIEQLNSLDVAEKEAADALMKVQMLKEKHAMADMEETSFDENKDSISQVSTSSVDNAHEQEENEVASESSPIIVPVSNPNPPDLEQSQSETEVPQFDDKLTQKESTESSENMVLENNEPQETSDITQKLSSESTASNLTENDLNEPMALENITNQSDLVSLDDKSLEENKTQESDVPVDDDTEISSTNESIGSSSQKLTPNESPTLIPESISQESSTEYIENNISEDETKVIENDAHNEEQNVEPVDTKDSEQEQSMSDSDSEQNGFYPSVEGSSSQENDSDASGREVRITSMNLVNNEDEPISPLDDIRGEDEHSQASDFTEETVTDDDFDYDDYTVETISDSDDDSGEYYTDTVLADTKTEGKSINDKDIQIDKSTTDETEEEKLSPPETEEEIIVDHLGRKPIRFRYRYPKPEPQPPSKPPSQILEENSLVTVPYSTRWKQPSPQIKGLLESCKGEAIGPRANACGALKVLAAKSVNQRTLARTVGVLNALTIAITRPFLHENDPTELDVRLRGVTALLHMSMPAENRRLLFEFPKLVDGLVQAISEDSIGEACLNAITALVYLAKTPENKQHMAKNSELVTTLSRVISGKVDEKKESQQSVPNSTPSDIESFDDDQYDIDSVLTGDSTSEYSQYREQNSRRNRSQKGRGAKNNKNILSSEKMNQLRSSSRLASCAVLAHLVKHCPNTVSETERLFLPLMGQKCTITNLT